MKIVVFGGAGFLGGYLVEALVNQKHEVTVFDLKALQRSDLNFNSVIGDITNREDVARVLKGADFVYSLAAMSDIDKCIENPVEAVRLNVMAHAQIMDQCVKAEIKRFILASTLYVYSSTGGFYRSTKQACESLLEDYNQYYGLNYTILRYGTPYGPGANSYNSVYRFLKQAIEEGKIDYHGTGNEIREFIHAHDAARLSVKILDPEYENERVVLSGLHPIKISDFLTMIAEILGKKVAIRFCAHAKPVPDSHYQVIPYSYNPKIARKLIADSYLDLGQGILECIESIKKEEVRA